MEATPPWRRLGVVRRSEEINVATVSRRNRAAWQQTEGPRSLVTASQRQCEERKQRSSVTVKTVIARDEEKC
ncbi:hypothetical protein NDU88_004261 [Pleurodeles waltl]|uniref:Uncharacterized protein n=1 Tax=Pleurodeles waltl TaxID=8319 RepID=A0AAV7TQT9_PLEWA|nr:hypothetical protein NDU88_004261 [Pleurodeles waltl]